MDDAGKSAGSELVSILMPGRDLAEFIARMLGQRRTLSRDYQVTFRIKHEWLAGLIELINQRVAAQNHGRLVGFTVRYDYASGRTTTISEQSDFFSYNDVSQEISVGCRLNLTYLIQFPYKEGFERQDISVRIRTKSSDQTRNRKSAAFLRAVMAPINADISSFTVEIQHSDITWGEDMYNLISNQVITSFPQRRAWIDSVRVAFLPLALPITMLYVSARMTYLEISQKLGANAYITQVADKFNGTSGNLRDIEDKINLIHHYAALLSAEKGLANFISIVVAPVVAVSFFYFIIRLRNQSYVILNSATEMYVRKKDATRNLIKTVLLIGFVLSALAGVFGNAIYARLPEIW